MPSRFIPTPRRGDAQMSQTLNAVRKWKREDRNDRGMQRTTEGE